MLSIKNLSVSVEDQPILKGFNLEVPAGTVHALMGPNGSGKSTLASTLMGNPAYQITDGEILFNGCQLNQLSPDKRAQLGLFLAFQHPLEIAGVSVETLLYEAKSILTGTRIPIADFKQFLQDTMQSLSIDPSFAHRQLNVGCSGGEKKRLELLQMVVLNPALAILDEIDSGLDLDAIKFVAQGIKLMQSRNPQLSLIIITHYPRILHYIVPDAIHIIKDGHIHTSGTADLIDRLERDGYGAFL